MDFHLKTGEIYINYCPQRRTYYIPYKKKFGGGWQILKYCPWCGKKLPKSLSEEFFGILEKEFNLDTLYEMKKAPKEFQSDEWWKKRGL